MKKSKPQPQPQTKPSPLKSLFNYIRGSALIARYSALQRDPLKQKPEITLQPTETEQMFHGEKRIRAYALTDNLCDQSPVGATVATCIRLAIGTKGGNPVFTGPDADYWQAYFDEWKRSCGYNENEGLQTMLKIILRAVKVHGDCLVLCNELTGYKLRVFDADQITNITDFDEWKRLNNMPNARQVEGVVTDEQGKVLGYFVTMQRNRVAVDSIFASYIPAEACRRVSATAKISQYRGEPFILTNQELTEETQDLLKSEVMAAKLASELSLVIKRQGTPEADAVSALLDGLDASEQAEAGITEDTLKEMQDAADATKTFDMFAGKASIAQLPEGSDIQNLSSNRPGTQILEWINNLNDSNGRLLGVMSCLSRGRADNSYSSGQIELSISWTTFEEDQKLLERLVIDYICSRICPNQPYIVRWPKAFQIDPERSQKVVEAQLRTGNLSYRELLGPDYEDQLKQIAHERELLRSLGLADLSVFQTASGAVVETTNQEEENNG